MKNYFVLFLILQFFTISNMYSQSIPGIHQESSISNLPIPIDGTPLLKSQALKSAEFYKKNPDFLKRSKLNKTSGWNFKVGDKKIWYSVDFTIQKEYPTQTTCRAVGKHCYIFVQDSVWNNNITQSGVDSIASVFDNTTFRNPNKGIYQTNTEVFGEPPDVDNDPKIVIFLLDIIDNSATSGTMINGFFSTANELLQSTFPLSNEAEIIYIDITPNYSETSWVLSNYLSTLAHEFQHLIAWNYHKVNSQMTFTNEGCSLTAEVINGFPIYQEYWYLFEPNHYLFDWRDGSFNVINDYSRAARFHVYLYEQFGSGLFKNIVQSDKFGIESYNDALTKIGSNLQIEDIIKNWFIANINGDKSTDTRYGYSSTIVGRPVETINFFPGNTIAKMVNPYSVEYVSLESGKNVKVMLSSTSESLKITALLKGIGGKKVIDVTPNSIFTDPELGTKYKTCTFIFMNLSSVQPAAFNCKILGDTTSVELKWYQDNAMTFFNSQPLDTIGVPFDAVPGGKLDSVKIGVYRQGEISGKIYYLTGKFGEPVTRSGPTPISELFSAKYVQEPHYLYINPPVSWLKIDLRNEQIKTDKPFYVGIYIPADTTKSAVLLGSYIKGYDDYYQYAHVSNMPFWVTFDIPTTGRYPIPMISAFVSFPNAVSKVTENILLKYSLSQNYPNPFNPSTKIAFSIPRKGVTTIKIYDLMGREVKTLMNEIIEAGDHTIKFSAENLSSGIYFYKIQCDDFVNIKKMVLLR
jgi:hypothetical protein